MRIFNQQNLQTLCNYSKEVGSFAKPSAEALLLFGSVNIIERILGITHTEQVFGITHHIENYPVTDILYFGLAPAVGQIAKAIFSCKIPKEGNQKQIQAQHMVASALTFFITRPLTTIIHNLFLAAMNEKQNNVTDVFYQQLSLLSTITYITGVATLVPLSLNVLRTACGVPEEEAKNPMPLMPNQPVITSIPLSECETIAKHAGPG